MKLALQMSAAGLSAILLASCGSTGGTAGNHPSGTGPFDSRGNYVEDWADSPSKWKRGGGVPSKPGESLVMNDEPPADSVPIPTAENTRQPGDISSTPIVSRPVPVSTTRKTTASTTSTASKPKTTASTASRPKTTAAKPKTVAKKPAPKKATTARYTIKKGDTLSAIAARNKTSVAALQRANGIKGSLIQPGKSLVIPK